MGFINNHLTERYKTIMAYTGLILIFCGFVMLTPLLSLIKYPQELPLSATFIEFAVLISSLGVALRFAFGSMKNRVLDFQESSIVVFLSWVIFCIFSAFPLMKIIHLDFTQAVFESVSAWTTTGLSVVDVDHCPYMVLLWRSIMQFCGGAGMAVIMMASIAGPSGAGLYSAEGKGSQMKPQVKDSARIVVWIYVGYAIIGTVSFYLAGMNWFDAVNHCFAAISTGGFSTHSTNIGFWDKTSIEVVAIILMIIGNVNFVTVYFFLKGKLKTVLKNGEIKVMMVLIPLSSYFVFLFTTRFLYDALPKQIRVAVFEVVTALTTTGFSTVSYLNWSDPGIFILIILMLIGGGTCSTAGGIKQYRIYVLYKTVLWQIKKSLLPRSAVKQNFVWEWENKDYITDSKVKEIANYVVLYFFLFFLGSFIIMINHNPNGQLYTMKEAFFEFSSALSTVGISIGVTNPNAPKVVLWDLTLGMFLGRLEFFIIFTGIFKILLDSKKLFRFKKS